MTKPIRSSASHYRPEIDGLRAVAVLPVILFHGGIAGFGGGFIGVDVFFVISGYLITSIIIGEMAAGSFTIGRFYERRMRRILPALFLVLAVCLPFAWFLLAPADLRSFAASLTAVSMFVSNMLFWRESGYFDTAAEIKPLLHTWSLAVEEQYYILFPPFMLLAWRLGRRWLVYLLAGIGLLSLAAAHWGATHSPLATFFLLPTRAWELLIGALAAFYLSARPAPAAQLPALRQGMGLLGLLAIGASVLLFDETTPFPSLYALLPTLGVLMIILFGVPGTWAGDILGARPLVAIGLISYSAYLWHQPVFAFARHAANDEPGWPVMLALGAASLLLAYFSWRFVEAPFRDRARVGRGAILGLFLCGTTLFIGIGVAGAVSNGFEKHYVERRLDASTRPIYELVRRHTAYDMYATMGDDGACNFWSKTVDAPFEARFERCAEINGKAVVVLGDSHAMNIYNALYRARFGAFVVGLSQGGCRPYEAPPFCHYDAFAAFASKQRQAIDVVLYHQSGSYLVRDFLGRPDTADLFDERKPYSINGESITRLIGYLKGLSSEHRVIWLGPFVEARANFGAINAIAAAGFRVNARSIAIFQALDDRIKRETTRLAPAARYVSLVDALDIGSDSLRIGDCVTFRDGDHFSRCGERLFGERIRRALRDVGVAPAPRSSRPDQ